MDPEVARLANRFCSAAEVGGAPFSAFSGVGELGGDFLSASASEAKMACSAASRAAAWMASLVGLTDLALVSRSSGDLRTDK